MNAEKAAYWIAVGVLALGLNSEYRQGNFTALHRATDRADAVVCEVSNRVERALAAVTAPRTWQAPAADVLVASAGKHDIGAFEAESVELRAEQLRAQVQELHELAQADGILAKSEIGRVHAIRVLSQMPSQLAMLSAGNKRVMVVCPKTKTGTRIVVKDGD